MSSKKTPKVNGIFYDSVEYGGGLSENFDENLSKQKEIRNKKGKEKKKSEDIKKTKRSIFNYIEKLNKFPSNRLNSIILTKGKNPIFIKKEQIKLIFDRKGIVGINLLYCFIKDAQSCNIADMMEHIEHYLELGGEDYLAFGTDFDAGRTLVPRPAAGITAFLIFINSDLRIFVIYY